MMQVQQHSTTQYSIVYTQVCANFIAAQCATLPSFFCDTYYNNCNSAKLCKSLPPCLLSVQILLHICRLVCKSCNFLLRKKTVSMTWLLEIRQNRYRSLLIAAVSFSLYVFKRILDYKPCSYIEAASSRKDLKKIKIQKNNLPFNLKTPEQRPHYSIFNSYSNFKIHYFQFIIVCK